MASDTVGESQRIKCVLSIAIAETHLISRWTLTGKAPADQLNRYASRGKEIHTQTMSNNDGDFSKWQFCQGTKYRQCGSKNVKYREWDSSCGGYTDYNYCCQDCGYSWWIDGPDA
jgi:hypothetical protein